MAAVDDRGGPDGRRRHGTRGMVRLSLGDGRLAPDGAQWLSDRSPAVELATAARLQRCVSLYSVMAWRRSNDDALAQPDC